MKKVLFGMALTIVTCFSCSQRPQGAKDESVPMNSDSIIRINCMMNPDADVLDSVIVLSKELVKYSQKDSGNMDYDLYQSPTDPRKLMIFENWKSQKDLSSHSRSAHFTRLVPQIQKLVRMETDIFQRGISMNAKPTAKDTVIRINCSLVANINDFGPAQTLCQELTNYSVEDGGNINYNIYQNTSDVTKMVIVETWKDQKSLDNHMKAPHFTRLVPQIQKCGKVHVEIFKKLQ